MCDIPHQRPLARSRQPSPTGKPFSSTVPAAIRTPRHSSSNEDRPELCPSVQQVDGRVLVAAIARPIRHCRCAQVLPQTSPATNKCHSCHQHVPPWPTHVVCPVSVTWDIPDVQTGVGHLLCSQPLRMVSQAVPMLTLHPVPGMINSAS